MFIANFSIHIIQLTTPSNQLKKTVNDLLHSLNKPSISVLALFQFLHHLTKLIIVSLSILSLSFIFTLISHLLILFIHDYHLTRLNGNTAYEAIVQLPHTLASVFIRAQALLFLPTFCQPFAYCYKCTFCNTRVIYI